MIPAGSIKIPSRSRKSSQEELITIFLINLPDCFGPSTPSAISILPLALFLGADFINSTLYVPDVLGLKL